MQVEKQRETESDNAMSPLKEIISSDWAALKLVPLTTEDFWNGKNLEVTERMSKCRKRGKQRLQLKCTERVWKRFMRTPQMVLCKRLGNKQTLLGQHECTDSKNGQKSLPLCKVPETEAPGGYDNLWCTQQSLAATGNWCIWTWRKPPPADNWLLQLFFWN